MTDDIAATLNLQDLLVELINSLSTIKALSEIDCGANDERSLIRHALSSLISNQNMESCSFFVLDNDGWLVNVTGVRYDEPDAVESHNAAGTSRFRVGEGIIGLAAASGQTQHCENCAEDERFSRGGERRPLGSIISVPVFTLNKQLIGVLNISHSEPYFFGDWHLRLLDVYKNIFGQLVTNFRLFRNMERQIAARTAELEKLVGETQRLKDHYATMAMQDQLTGLNNRRYFYQQVEMVAAHHKRYDAPFCLLVIDIDHFKHVNDQYGHVVGDQVLVKVGDTLRHSVRATDILARFGGEEFVIIFMDLNRSKGKDFAERIRRTISELDWTIDGHTLKVSVSIGLYCATIQDQKQLNIDQILHRADTALYFAKAQGRNQVAVYTPDFIAI
jgi:diguanylate cyclase (GGDEF)-like protein